jgi:hypothetical protein
MFMCGLEYKSTAIQQLVRLERTPILDFLRCAELGDTADHNIDLRGVERINRARSLGNKPGFWNQEPEIRPVKGVSATVYLCNT